MGEVTAFASTSYPGCHPDHPVPIGDRSDRCRGGTALREYEWAGAPERFAENSPPHGPTTSSTGPWPRRGTRPPWTGRPGSGSAMIQAAARAHAGAVPCSRQPAGEVGGAVLGVPPPCPVRDLGGELGEGQRHRLVGIGLLLDGPGLGREGVSRACAPTAHFSGRATPGAPMNAACRVWPSMSRPGPAPSSDGSTC